MDGSNLDEYDDPERYDAENGAFEPDGPLYLELAARFGGPVLDIACGTGRIAVPLARAGHRVTALDVAPGMLRRGREKAPGLAIRWVEADMRSFALADRFGMAIVAGGSFQHLLSRSDQDAAVGCVRRHLAPGGGFVVHAAYPQPWLLVDAPTETPWFSYVDAAGREVAVSGIERYDAARSLKHETAIRRWTEPDGRRMEHVARLSLRFSTPEEIEDVVASSGFTVVDAFGDWDQSPLRTDSPQIIYVCSSSRTRRGTTAPARLRSGRA